MYFLLPIVLLIVSLVPFLFLFKIKDEDIVTMNAEIAEREASAKAQA